MVVNKAIEIESNKDILTLVNGSVTTLGKGNVIQQQNKLVPNQQSNLNLKIIT